MLNFKSRDHSMIKAEEQLASLPSKCNCKVCRATRDMVKREIGEKKYYKISKELGRAY